MSTTHQSIQQSFVHAAGVFFYTIVVATILMNGGKIFGPMRTVWGPVTFLMLFVLSATIVGLLVLGKPVILYANGAKGEAIKFLGYTIGWLCLILALVLLTQTV